MLIDLLAVGLGALASRPMGPFAFRLGLGLAVLVTICFVLLIVGTLAVEGLYDRWVRRN
jgi:hypothetical protein